MLFLETKTGRKRLLHQPNMLKNPWIFCEYGNWSSQQKLTDASSRIAQNAGKRRAPTSYKVELYTTPTSRVITSVTHLFPAVSYNLTYN